MNSQEFTEAVRENTRLYQGKQRSCELRCAEASRDEIALEQRIAKLLRQVALLQLEDMGTLESEVARELEFRADEEQALRAEMSAIDREIADHLAEIRSQSAIIKAAMAQPDSRAEELRAAQREYQRARAELAENAAAEPELRAEIDGKLARYRDDPLYAWLREAGYGTPGYARDGDAAAGDQWIARLCHFDENRQNEEMLLAMRAALPERGARLAGRVEEARRALDELGRPLTGAERIARQVAPLEAAIAQAEARARHVEASMADYAARRDPRYRKAQELLAASLKAQPLEALIARVRATPDPEDDRLALEIVNLHDKLAGSRRDYERALAARQHAEADLRRAAALEDALRQGRWMDGVEYGEGLALQRLLTRHMNQEIDGDAVLQTVQRHALRRAAYNESVWGSS